MITPIKSFCYTHRYALVFWALVILRMLFNAVLPLMDKTEARYGEIARIMSETGNWITPSNRLRHPPFGQNLLCPLGPQPGQFLFLVRPNFLFVSPTLSWWFYLLFLSANTEQTLSKLITCLELFSLACPKFISMLELSPQILF